MIDQIVQFAVEAGAPPANVIPDVFNPVPADGILTVWAVLDALDAGDQAAQMSVTLGGATPFQPVQPSAIRVNVDGQNGAGPSLSDILMSPQGVRQGTNSQLNLQGGTNHTQTGRFRVRFETMDEVSSRMGSVVA